MIGRKLMLLQNGQLVVRENELTFHFPALEEWRQIAIKAIKKYSYTAFVALIRSYFRTLHILRNKYWEIADKMKRVSKRGHLESEKKEISKFLKTISNYKRKIRRIKDKVKKEENVL